MNEVSTSNVFLKIYNFQSIRIPMQNIHNPFYKEPVHPNYCRRCRTHDYKRPSRYMITILKSDTVSTLSKVLGSPFALAGNNDFPRVEVLTSGEFIEEAINGWLEKYTQIRISDKVIMPDHIHICVDVHKFLEVGLSRAVSNLMGRVSRLRHDAIPEHLRPAEMQPFFQKGFNDRIAYDYIQWERQQKYIDDNPRRYLVKRMFPEYYRNVWIVSAGDWQFYALGNVFLLKNPDIQAVRFSRKFREDEFERYVVNWKKCVENTGVLVSPFIHKKEKDIRDYAIEYGASIIRICENGFEGRFSPQGLEFDLMMQARLLLVYPMAYENESKAISYGKAQEMNRIAARIAGTDWYGNNVSIRKC